MFDLTKYYSVPNIKKINPVLYFYYTFLFAIFQVFQNPVTYALQNTALYAVVAAAVSEVHKYLDLGKSGK